MAFVYRPSAHGAQLVEAGAPEKVPGRQSLQPDLALFDVVPEGQGEHDELPARLEKLPAAQDEHAVAPKVAEKAPGKQGTHTPGAPAAEPGRHKTQLALLSAPGATVVDPAAHRVQLGDAAEAA